MGKTSTKNNESSVNKALDTATGSAFPECCGIYFGQYAGFPVILDVGEESMEITYTNGDTEVIYNDTPMDWWISIKDARHNDKIRRPEGGGK